VDAASQPAALTAPAAARRLSARTALAVAVGGLFLLHFVLALAFRAPFVFADELLYTKLARSIASGGGFTIDGVASSYPPLYSLVLAPLTRLRPDPAQAYTAAQVLNVVLMSAAVAPVYVLARRVLPERDRVAAVVLSSLAPFALYSGLVLSESLAYLLFTISLVAWLRAVEHPGLRREVPALAATGLACLARPQAVVLLPIAATTMLAVAGRGAARYRTTWVALAVLVCGALVAAAAGLGPSHAAGAYSVLASASPPSVVSLARLWLYHLAELDLAVGVLPLAAVAFGVWFARRSSRPAPERAFAALAAASVLWLTLEVAYFAATARRIDPGYGLARLHERYLIYVFPLCVIALLWLGRRVGVRRLAPVSVPLALLPAVIPFGAFVNNASVVDTLGLAPWARHVHGDVVPVAHARLLAVVVALVLVGAFALRRRTSPVAVLATYFSVVSACALLNLLDASRGARDASFSGSAAWVDHAAPPGEEAAILTSPTSNHLASWETEFFNRSITRSYALCAPRLSRGWERRATLRARVADFTAPLVVAPTGLAVEGTVVARDRKGGLELVRVEGPVRLAGPAPSCG
jgi:4-amino-4-deoxy-L-arabinose transferase-like glycosyltransferase